MKKTGLILLLTLLLSTCVSAAFSDVPDDHWAAPAIEEMVGAHVTAGFPDGTFRPGDTVSCAQFLAMTVRASYRGEIPRAGADEAWWQPYYDIANDAYLMQLGYGNDEWVDRFVQPAEDDMKRPITRYEAAVLLAGAESGFNRIWNAARGTSAFSDAASVPLWYETDLQTAADSGLLGGYPDGAFRGQNTMTRAQACVAVRRLHAHSGLVGETERPIWFDGKVLVKYRKNENRVELTSLSVADRRVLQTMTAPLARQLPVDQADETFDQTVLGEWMQNWRIAGLCGLYEYDASGKIRQITARPVIHYSQGDDGAYLIVTVSPGSPTYFSDGGATCPVGTQILRIQPNGSETVLLSNAPAHGMNIQAAFYGADGTLHLRTIFLGKEDNQAYLRQWEYAVEGGKLRTLTPTGAELVYSNHITPAEAAAEQARLDQLGVGVGSK